MRSTRSRDCSSDSPFTKTLIIISSRIIVRFLVRFVFNELDIARELFDRLAGCFAAETEFSFSSSGVSLIAKYALSFSFAVSNSVLFCIQR